MAKLIIQCENCGEEREVDERMAGSTLACAGCGETIRIPIPDIEAGVILGGFVLEKQLGFGAMGEVWLAHQQTMDRKVALKLLSREFTLDSQFVDRFLKEVRLSAKMDHPNIITAFDAGCDKDIHFLAISFVDGFDLDQRLTEVEILPEKEALKIVHEISSALCYAWNDFKILHRDIKPANIMIDKKGSAKLMDMGISKSVNEEAQLTMTGTVIGTPYYMSPEQGMGEKDLDCRSDIYSLGATLYHLVTGALPFEATTAIGIISKHITEPLPPPQNTNPDLSDACTAFLEIMMAKGCEDRQQTWEEVIEDIDMVLAEKMPTSKHRPNAGDSVVMRAITDDDLPANAKQTAVTPDESLPETATESRMPEQPLAPAVKKSKAPLVIILSIAAMLVLMGMVFLIFRRGGKAELDNGENINKDHFPEEFNPEPAPIVKQPIKPTPSPQPQTDPNDKRYSEMWTFAAKFAKDNPGNLDVAISNFEEISRTTGGSKYKMMADVEISRLFKAKDKAVNAVMDTLHEKAKPYKDKQDFPRVVDIYEHYSGPWDQETQEKRQQIADEYRQKGDEHSNKQLTDHEKRRLIMHATVSRILEDIINGKKKQAYIKLQVVSKKLMLPGDVREPLEQLLTIGKNVLDSFQKDIGKKITLKMTHGNITVTVKKIRNKIIYISEKKGRVVTQKRLLLNNLSEDEIIERSGMNSVATAMFKSLRAAKAKKMDDAKRYIEQIHGDLRDIFEEVMVKHYMPEEIQEDDNTVSNSREPQDNRDFNNDKRDSFDTGNRRRPPNAGSHKIYGELHRKLRKADPAYNDQARIFGEHGKIEEVDLYEAQGINNKSLRVLAKLPDLKILDLGRTPITDLSPLAATKLERLILRECNDLKDLKPLSKIKTLRELSINETRISNIKSLKGLKLKMLDISGSRVEDIKVLKGMPLRGLRMRDCSIKDYSVLKTLKNLQFIEPINLWKKIPGKEHMAKKRMPQKHRRPDNRFNDDHNDDFLR